MGLKDGGLNREKNPKYESVDVTGETRTGSLSTEGTHTKRLDGRIHFCREYDGSDEDERLDNAISEATGGDVIILEHGAEYTKSRTGDDAITESEIGRGVTIQGFGWDAFNYDSTWIYTDWEIDIRALQFQQVAVVDGTITFGESQNNISHIGLAGNPRGELIAAGNRTLLSHIQYNGEVTFSSDTDEGEIGVVSGGVAITDNGNNSIL